MTINPLKERSFDKKVRLTKRYSMFNKLVMELATLDLNDSTIQEINQFIDQLNDHHGSNQAFSIHLRKIQSKLLRYLEKTEKLVVKNHYRSLWLAVGMSAFGLPIGVAFSSALGNVAFIGIGLPIGMAIGIAVGANLDKKALQEGRQLDVDLG